MSNFDDSAARRDRRAREERQDWRSQPAPERDDRRPQSSQRDYDDQYSDPRPVDRSLEPQQPPRTQNSFSGFSRHQYEPPQADPAPRPPRFEQAPPPRDYEQAPPPPPSYSAQPREQFNRYQEPQAYVPPPPPPAEQPQSGFYGERSDLYDRDNAHDRSGNASFGGQRLYEPAPEYRPAGRHDDYDQGRRTLIDTAARSPAAPLEEFPHLARNAPTPQDEYDRNFTARLAAQAQEPPATSRFYLPQDPVPQARDDQGFDDGPRARFDQNYDEPRNAQPARYNQDGYLSRPTHDAGWDADAFDQGGRHGQITPYGDGRSPLDEDYFADDDEPLEEQTFAPRKSRKMLIAASLGGALIVGGGGAYLYKSMKGGDSNQASAVIQADTRPTKDVPADAGGRQFPNGNKAIYKRLTEDGTEINASASVAAPDKPAAPAGSSLEDRIDEALKKAQRPGNPDSPTVVRSETYRPDGSKLSDSGNRFVVAGSSNAAQGQLPPPFSASPAPGSGQFAVAPIPSGPLRPSFAPSPAPAAAKSASAAPIPKPASAAAPASASSSNAYSVQLGASQDEKLAANQLSSMSEKYSSVLGNATVSTKTVDLGPKGVWFRTIAGPLDSAEAAADLCKQLKAAGQKDCIVRKPE